MSNRARRTGVPGALRRLTRLLVGPGALRRPSDRLEGILIVMLAAAFLAVAALAPGLALRYYRSEQAAAARLRPATAVLTQTGPPSSYMSSLGEAQARWRAPDGRWRSGPLTTLTAPDILGARAGARIRVWLTGSGQPQNPPPGGAEVLFAVVVTAVGAVCTAGLLLAICYWLGRLALDRRRLAAWTSEWSLTGPGWTTRL